MERGTWTNERLDDLAESMRNGFERIDRNFDRVDREIRDLRAELKAEIVELRQTMLRVGGGMVLGFISVLAAILARGA